MMNYRNIIFTIFCCGALLSCAGSAAFAEESESAVSSSADRSSAWQAPEKVTVAQGLYELTNAMAEDYVLDIRYCTFAEEDSHGLQLYHALDVNQQKFYFEELSGHVYRIAALHSGEVLTADRDSEEATETSVPVIMSGMDLSGHTASVTQLWSLEDAGDGYYYIRSHTGKYLTLDTFRPHLGATVSLQKFAAKKTQKWKLNSTWISAEDTADTDLINPYAENGAYEDLTLTIRIGSDKKVLTGAEIASCVTETEDHTLSTDTSLFTALAQQLADEYDTQGHPRRFHTSHGQDITLYKGNFGWKLDVDETAALLQEAAMSGSQVEVEPVWEHEGVLFTRGDDIGDSYVEIDLTNQKVWLYKDGELLLETDCVTGTYGTDRQTPGGVYSVYYRQSPDVLNGADYESYVEYWMAFNGNIGMHDANWRYSFGGDIFRTNGSHGCVNLPTDAAAQIYEVAQIGYPVVCYN